MALERYPLVLTVPEAGRMLGIGRDAAYAAAERGELPAIRVGRRLVVPTYRLLQLAGWPEHLIARAFGIPTESEEPDGLRHRDEPTSSLVQGSPPLG